MLLLLDLLVLQWFFCSTDLRHVKCFVIKSVFVFYSFALLLHFFADKDHNFKKYDLREIDYLNEVYDTDSIMHYGKTSFSKNGKPTILALGDPSKPLGQRNGFSQTDIAQLNALYDCAGNVRKSVDLSLRQIVWFPPISTFILSFQVPAVVGVHGQHLGLVTIDACTFASGFVRQLTWQTALEHTLIIIHKGMSRNALILNATVMK